MLTLCLEKLDLLDEFKHDTKTTLTRIHTKKIRSILFLELFRLLGDSVSVHPCRWRKANTTCVFCICIVIPQNRTHVALKWGSCSSWGRAALQKVSSSVPGCCSSLHEQDTEPQVALQCSRFVKFYSELSDSNWKTSTIIFTFFIFGPVSAQLEVDKDAKTASFLLLLVIDHYSGVVCGQGQAHGAGSLTQQSSSTTPGISVRCGCCFALIPLYICF